MGIKRLIFNMDMFLGCRSVEKYAWRFEDQKQTTLSAFNYGHHNVKSYAHYLHTFFKLEYLDQNGVFFFASSSTTKCTV